MLKATIGILTLVLLTAMPTALASNTYRCDREVHIGGVVNLEDGSCYTMGSSWHEHCVVRWYDDVSQVHVRLMCDAFDYPTYSECKNLTEDYAYCTYTCTYQGIGEHVGPFFCLSTWSDRGDHCVYVTDGDPHYFVFVMVSVADCAQGHV